MSHPPSRLLTRLDDAIAKAGDTVEGDCLRAERAIYLARDGDVLRAKEALVQLKAKYLQRPNLAMSCWLWLLDGLSAYFEDARLTRALDAISRAQALATSGNLPRLEGLSSAWLAHLEFMKPRPKAVRENVLRAMEKSPKGDFGIESRVAMILAFSFHFAGRLDLAQPWYRGAHNLATNEGDRATISALLHNEATLRLANVRHSRYRANVVADGGAFALLSAQSNEQFDLMRGSAALAFLTPMLLAQALTLDARYDEALELFTAETAKSVSQGAAKWHPVYCADKAWCHVQLGQTDQALASASEATQLAQGDVQIEDLASVHSRLAEVFELLNMTSERQAHAAEAESAWAAYERIQSDFLGALADIRAP